MSDKAKASAPTTGTDLVKRGMAEQLKGGVIMDVVTAEQAKIAEDAGAVAVMALERVPADIRAQGGVARMSDPDLIQGIIDTVSIPVMAKARIGHFVEAQVLESLGVDYIDESEVLTPADYANHIDKWKFTVPFVCGATNLGEALRRISEGAAMIRSKGEAGTGDVSNATTHIRTIRAEIARLTSMPKDELFVAAKELQAPLQLVQEIAETGKLPVVMFVAGGIATPADAAMMMQLGAEGVFVGSGIFKSGNPAAARRGNRQGDDLLRRPQGDRGCVARPWRGDGWHQRRRRPRAPSAVRARLVGVPVGNNTAANPREAARLIVLDPDNRVFLLNAHDPAEPERTWWFTPGGGIDDGETAREAAVRELREEVGYVLDPASLEGPVWERTAYFDFMDEPFVQHEVFFIARVGPDAPRVEHEWSATERDMLDGTGWFAPDAIAGIDIEVFPEVLGELIHTLLPWNGTLRHLDQGKLAWAKRD